MLLQGMIVLKSMRQRQFPNGCGRYIVAFLALIILTIHEGTGQYYLIGNDPASVRWRQIKTKNFKVIYPYTWEKQGQYIANGLEYVYVPEGRSLYNFTPRTPVIIHNQTTNPTSDTYIAPRRMDYFTAPPQDIYPQDWVDQLIIHEFRHAVQYSAVNCGVTKALSYVLGEQGVLAVFGLFLPMWFIEGDATVAETAFHSTGRGRTPSFEMRLRAQLVQKGIYPYEKANYGSYRDFVPGKYELGYQLVGLSRDSFGQSIWNNVLNNVGRRPYTLVPFSSALRKQTGLNKYQLYSMLIGGRQKNWLEEDKLIKENNYQVITNSSEKLYTNYKLPVVFRDSLIIAVKSSIDDLTKVVLFSKGGKEKYLFTLGVNYYSESLTASDSIIYWSELVNDPRWLLRDYRVIKSYRFDTGKTEQLTHLTRYYSPSVTRDGRYIAAVEVTADNKYFLVILNSKDGSLIRRIRTPDNLLFIHPGWSEDGKQIVSVVFGKDGNSIAIINPETGIAEILLPYSLMEMKRPSYYLNYILYTASYNGIDNIYAFDRCTKHVFKITSARFGASDASVTKDRSSIIYSNYTADGYELVKEKLDTTLWNKISVPQKSAFPLAEKLTEQESFIYNADSVPEIKFDSKPYSKLLNLVNFHSWAPVGIDLQNFSAAPGVTLLSQNLLGTTVTALGYLYNRNERAGKYYLSVSDESLYPAIDLKVDYGGRKDLGIYTKNDSVPEKWNEFNLSAGLRLPLNWVHNSWIRSFQPSISINYKHLKMDGSVPFRFEHDQIVAVRYSLIASNALKTSHRDILTRWSQLLQLSFDNTPFIRKSSNSLFAGQVTMDFPGIGRHHVISLYGGYQKRKEDFYPFSDLIVFPRGYTEITRDEISSFSATYSMPLFYPEWQIGNLMYFKRFKTALFYDFAKSTDHFLPRFFSSVGLDLTSDFALFNFIAPFDAGLRSVYNPETGKMKFELLFSLNFGGMY